ncbi:MAG: hypothetical protein QMD14_00545, partial [Candidatus Aenigmarchaeota archaeon]|nr:hypothetical protein [Candidatus Aenigmarchaeota archaeon]
MNKVLIFALIFGILLGTLTGVIISKLFPGMAPYFKKELPITTMILIFLLNSFLATLICYGGILFSLAEVRVYKFSIYRALDVVFDPLYNLLSKISEDMKRLKPMYRSCYLSISYFPIGCIFLFAVIISTYFSIFLSILGFSILSTLLKLLPHLTLETLAFL